MSTITIQATINAPLETVWQLYTQPEHIMQWNSASDDWHTPKAENDLQVGGTFFSRMEAKDGSMGFDFSGTYTDVQEHRYIEYKLEDGRKVMITFDTNDGATHVVVHFEAESENSEEMQREGWQAILNNFKKYAENQ